MKKTLKKFRLIVKKSSSMKTTEIHREKKSVKKSNSSEKITSSLTKKENRAYTKFLGENNLTKTKKSFSKFKAYENKMKKIKRTEKAFSVVGKTLSSLGISEKLEKTIKSNVISYYRGAVGFTEKQFDKLVNDMRKINDLDLAKKVLPKIARPDTSQLKWVKQVNNLKDLTTALFRDDGDLYLELKDTIIQYNENKEQLINDKERGIKNMPISDYLSLRWSEEKEAKEDREQEELAELNQYI